MQEVDCILEVVEAVKATQRIPHEEMPSGVTFFSRLDEWQYVGMTDGVICEACRGYEESGTFTGTMLRSLFPFLEILDIDTIAVNAHPNCRCYLERIVNLPSQ